MTGLPPASASEGASKTERVSRASRRNDRRRRGAFMTRCPPPLGESLLAGEQDGGNRWGGSGVTGARPGFVPDGTGKPRARVRSRESCEENEPPAPTERRFFGGIRGGSPPATFHPPPGTGQAAINP